MSHGDRAAVKKRAVADLRETHVQEVIQQMYEHRGHGAAVTRNGAGGQVLQKLMYGACRLYKLRMSRFPSVPS